MARLRSTAFLLTRIFQLPAGTYPKQTRKRKLFIYTLLLLAICALPGVSAAQTNDNWLGGSGTWNNPANWSSGVPNGNFNVFIDNGNSAVSAVTLDTNPTIHNLTIDSDDSLLFNLNTILTVNGGSISNAGRMVINGGSATNSFLSLGANTTLNGGGTITLNTIISGGGAAIIQGNGTTLTNVNNTIQGDGTIGNGSLALVNQVGGVINANSTGAGGTLLQLFLNGSGNVTNAGLLEATNSGQLIIQNVVNNLGGTITANGSSAQVQLQNASIQGGTLSTLNSGTFETQTGFAATLDGSTHGALTLSTGSTYTGALNSITNILGTITNNGNFQVNGGNATNTSLNLQGSTTLQGTGRVTLNTIVSGGGAAFIQGNGTTLTNVNNTIQGDGIIGGGSLALVNQAGGVINANSTGAGGTQLQLFLNGSGNVTNAGLLEATNSGQLIIQNAINNLGGTITANGSSAQVQLQNASIQGGTLSTLNSGIMATPTGFSATLDGTTQGALTLSSGSTYTGALNSITNILGTITNNGIFQLNGGSATNTYLNLRANTTLNGGGTITLNSIVSGGGAAFIQGNSTTLTNVNNTIQGDGIIGGGSLALVNQAGGVINANSTGAGGTLLQLFLNGSGNVTNAGLLEATNSGQLIIQNTINNLGGTITANGSSAQVLMQGGDIQGGTLNTIGGGTFSTPTGFSAILDGSTHGPLTLSTGSTYTSGLNSITNILGTITNTGNFQLNGGSATNTALNLLANTTLQGGTVGRVTLNTIASGGGAATIQGNSMTLTNGDTIQGDGVIGGGSLAVINKKGAVINANSTGGGALLQLFLNGSGNVTNAGLLEATNSGQLIIQNAINNLGGTITANGSSAQVQLQNGAIQGGTLSTLNGGTITTPTGLNATLDGTTHGALTLSKGTYTGQLNSVTNIRGVINNNGNFQFNGGSAANTFLNLIANTTLQGAGKGKITLSTNPSGGGAAIIQGNGLTLTNTNNTIQGNGVIGNGSLTLVNGTAGTLLANVSGQTLLINGSGGLTNRGTMTVAAGAAMHVTGGPFTNFAAGTLTGGTYNDAGTLQIDELGSSGGEIVTNAANIILMGPSSSFVDAAGNNALSALNTNASTGSFTINSGRNFTTAGNFTNNGVLTVGSSNSTFDVNGNLTNFSGTTLTGGTYNLTGTLQFNGANIVTNAANIALTGTASQIVNQTAGNGLANFAVNNGSFTIGSGRNFTTVGNFTNNGTLAVASSNSKFTVNGSLINFSGTTLTGGSYNLTGTLQFNGANIVTNAANITLTGTGSAIVNQSSANGLAGFATNAVAGGFNLQGGRSFTTAGNFTNLGSFTIGTGSAFTVGGPGAFTQMSGITTDNGTLAAAGAFSLQAGSLMGKGSINGNLVSSGTVTPGTSTAATGILIDHGSYTQNSSGVLDISIGGITAGTKFDNLNSSTASLNGTLDVNLVNGFVPKVGNSFKIMNFTSENGTFATVNGLAINNNEHFTLTYQPTDVLLSVVSGPLPAPPLGGNVRFNGGTGRFGLRSLRQGASRPWPERSRMTLPVQTAFPLRSAPSLVAQPRNMSAIFLGSGRETGAPPSHLTLLGALSSAREAPLEAAMGASPVRRNSLAWEASKLSRPFGLLRGQASACCSAFTNPAHRLRPQAGALKFRGNSVGGTVSLPLGKLLSRPAIGLFMN